MSSDAVNKFTYECDCGCGELKFAQWKDDGVSFIGYYIPAYDAHQISILEKIFRRAKIIWNILIGKEYCLYEIVIADNHKLNEFKEFVANMSEIEKESEHE